MAVESSHPPMVHTVDARPDIDDRVPPLYLAVLLGLVGYRDTSRPFRLDGSGAFATDSLIPRECPKRNRSGYITTDDAAARLDRIDPRPRSCDDSHRMAHGESTSPLG